MRVMDHPNVISLKHCFFSTTNNNELFLNLVMEYLPESMYRVLKHYSDAKQPMPLLYVKLYMYQVCIILPSKVDLFSPIICEINYWTPCRFSEDWRISTLCLEFATGIWSLKIFWYASIATNCWWKDGSFYLRSFLAVCRLILLPTRLSFVILGVQKCWYVHSFFLVCISFCSSIVQLQLFSWMIVPTSKCLGISTRLSTKRDINLVVLINCLLILQNLQHSENKIWL